METVNFGGDNPQPRFGHTICLISSNRIVLFGGTFFEDRYIYFRRCW